MPSDQETPHGVHSSATTADILLEIVQALARELHPHRRWASAATFDSLLEQDLGFDSLGRVELLQRLERTFGVHLPDQVLASAETPRDLLRAVEGAGAAAQPLRPRALESKVLSAVDAAPSAAATLVEVLHWHVQSHPERLHIHLYAEDGAAQEITYADLYERATSVAAGLRDRGLQPGQTVALMLPTSRDFFESFYGVLLAGGVPVPIYPPMRLSQIEDYIRRQASILTSALVSTLITVPEVQRLVWLLQSQLPKLDSVVTVQELLVGHGEDPRPVVQGHDLALLQYTSGSTGTPKGVMLSHANLLANIRAMGQIAQTTSQEVFVSWLPLYHDMGLIGAWLGSLYYACPLVLMSPLAFLARPERWLWAIHRHRGTLSAAPNFAYELCLRRIDDRDIEGLDLSSWHIALNGAEPISPETVTRFCERFAKYGFRPEAMTPVYGLAESSVGLAFSPLGRGLRMDRIKREPFGRSGRAVPADPEDPTALNFVACGQPLPGHQIRIVDATGYEVAERQVGRLEFQGPSATSGYFRNAAETRRLFHGEWLDSGDLAYIAGGDVYLTGRVKDIIIRAGRNIYPHELEEAIGNLTGIRKGCVVAFGSPDPTSGTERLVVLAETRETDIDSLERLRREVDGVVLELVGAPADDVVLVPPQTVLKTSSGKVRRAASRERYERGDIGGAPRAVWWQVTRLAWAGMRPQLWRAMRSTADVLYAAYAWTLVGVFAAVLWIAVALAPRLSWRTGVAHVIARSMLRLFGIPVMVRGLEHLPRDTPYVMVVNHASYLDALVLIAALPNHIGYVAKRELAERFIPRLLFQRLGVEFVERFDAQRGVEDVDRVVQAVRRGRALVFFPEGTFGRAPGLQPFRMGAFVVAAETGVAVIPMAIRGTRSILRGGQWFPRRGIVHLTIGTAILPSGSGWDAAIQLRDAARLQILRYCGEPDLAPSVEDSPSAADL